MSAAAACVLATIAACSSSTNPDAGDARDVGELEAIDVVDESDAATSPSCPDLSGYYEEDGQCSASIGISIGPDVCWGQTSCQLFLDRDWSTQTSSGISVTLAPDHATLDFSPPDFSGSCDGTLSSSAISWNCNFIRLSTRAGTTCSILDRRVDLPGTTRACQCAIERQDCPSGRCTLVALAQGRAPVPACVDTPGTVSENMPCRWAQGIDNCVSGTVCTRIGVADASCRWPCMSSAECGAGQSCVRASTHVAAGVCASNCSAFAGTCGAGLVCQSVDIIEGNALVCTSPGTGANGDPCETLFGRDIYTVPGTTTHCGAESVCMAENGTRHCRSLCDAMHPCADPGLTCRLARSPGFIPPDVEFCAAIP